MDVGGSPRKVDVLNQVFKKLKVEQIMNVETDMLSCIQDRLHLGSEVSIDVLLMTDWSLFCLDANLFSVPGSDLDIIIIAH